MQNLKPHMYVVEDAIALPGGCVGGRLDGWTSNHLLQATVTWDLSPQQRYGWVLGCGPPTRRPADPPPRRPHLALLYPFWLGTDLDLPLYGSPLNRITISFHDYTIIFSSSNGIKALEPPDRPFFLIHFQSKNAFFYQKSILHRKTHLLRKKKAPAALGPA